MTVTTNTTPPNKTVTKIVTFYSDGTFSEFTPSPYLPQVPPHQPHLHPYLPPNWPQPWWQSGPTCGTIECKNEGTSK